METALLAGLGMAGVYSLSKNLNPAKNTQKNDPYLKQPHPNFSNNPSNAQNKQHHLEQTTPHALNTITNNSTVNDYHNPNQTTDRFFDMNNFNTIGTQRASEGLQGPTFTSLTGEVMHTNDFHHNNMAPYFGSKIRGISADVNTSELFLDRKAGMGSQQFSKREQAPLFKPQKDLAWTTGMPNQTDFMRSRINPSNLHNNVKPFEEIRVGPSLSGQPGIEGSGGYNSGLEYRDVYMPRSVDQLRVESNPKISYSLHGHEGAAKSLVQNRGELGEYHFYGPDKFFHNTPDRYLVTTGLEKAQQARALYEMRDQARIDTTREYQGTAGQSEMRAMPAPQNFQEPKREHVYGSIEGHAYAGGKYNATNADYGIKSFNMLPNNRVSNDNRTFFGAVQGALEAIVAPIVNTLRPTKKEDVIGNMIERGNVGKGESNGIYVVSPELKARTTYREMNPEGKQHLFVGNQEGNSYFLSQDSYLNDPEPQHRDTTTTSYMGGGMDRTMGIQLQSHVRDNQRHNNNRMLVEDRLLPGNTNMFNNVINTTRDVSRERENDMSMMRGQHHHMGHLGPENYATFTAMPTLQSEIDQRDRIDPGLLQAFKNNPYTHSLNSVA